MEKSGEHLIVGLGNPESDYADTRHNLCFACVRELARRLGVGIGKPARKGSTSGRHYVLGRFTRAEAERVPAVIGGVADALELALDAGVERAMDRYNRPGALACEELK